MVTKTRTRQILNTIDTNGCLKFPFNFLGVTLLESSTAGSDIKKIAVDNGRPLCSTSATKVLPMQLIRIEEFEGAYKGSPLESFITESIKNNGGQDLICVTSTTDIVGACKLEDAMERHEYSCSCKVIF